MENGIHSRTATPCSIRLARAVIGVLVVSFALMAGAWFARVPILQAAAQWWIVSEPVTPADAVAVLGGGLETRSFAAAEYYRKGLAKTILLADVRHSPSEKLGVLPPHTELNRQVIIRLGVPEQAIETFGSAVSSTREEALALRAWAERTRALSIVVPTEDFSSRRVRWMLDRTFAGTGVQVQVTALDALEYTRSDWWQHEQGLIAFQNEVIKYLYYRFKY